MRIYALDPFGGIPGYMGDRIFDSPYGALRDLLRDAGIELHTYDLTDISEAEKVLCFNYRKRFLQKCLKTGVPREKMVLFLFEPRVIIPEQYSPFIWRYFGTIFTFRDDLAAYPGFHKMLLPQEQQLLSVVPSFSDRNLLTMINANKYSYVDGELYSYRRRAIRFFEQHSNDFDLFGYDWDRNMALHPSSLLNGLMHKKPWALIKDVWQGYKKHMSYRGIIDQKGTVLSRYKYALCFENELDSPGYITEKIFDCLFCGTVPVYLGANNIGQYIPVDCFIDMRKFTGFSDLYAYLAGCSEYDFVRMQNAGQRYIRSEAFSQWRGRSVFQNIAKALV